MTDWKKVSRLLSEMKGSTNGARVLPAVPQQTCDMLSCESMARCFVVDMQPQQGHCADTLLTSISFCEKLPAFLGKAGGGE